MYMVSRCFHKIEFRKHIVNDIEKITGMEDGPSPSKRPFVVLSKALTESPKLASKACRRLMSDPTKLEDSHLPSSPRKAMQSLPLSPNKFSSPPKFSTSIEPRITRLQTPQKSSSSSSLASISSSDCVNEKVFQSPSRCPVRYLDLNSPVKKSPPKRPDLNCAIKSPLKRLDVGSPRRSPRKFNQENRCSPRRSPRKLPQYPMQFSSPSSLVSRLSLASPTSNKKNIAVGLFKPDGKFSLSLSFSNVSIISLPHVPEIQLVIVEFFTASSSSSHTQCCYEFSCVIYKCLWSMYNEDSGNLSNPASQKLVSTENWLLLEICLKLSSKIEAFHPKPRTPC